VTAQDTPLNGLKIDWPCFKLLQEKEGILIQISLIAIVAFSARGATVPRLISKNTPHPTRFSRPDRGYSTQLNVYQRFGDH